MEFYENDISKWGILGFTLFGALSMLLQVILGIHLVVIIIFYSIAALILTFLDIDYLNSIDFKLKAWLKLIVLVLSSIMALIAFPVGYMVGLVKFNWSNLWTSEFFSVLALALVVFTYGLRNTMKKHYSLAEVIEILTINKNPQIEAVCVGEDSRWKGKAISRNADGSFKSGLSHSNTLQLTKEGVASKWVITKKP